VPQCHSISAAPSVMFNASDEEEMSDITFRVRPVIIQKMKWQ
jgi:hypothetical protein